MVCFWIGAGYWSAVVCRRAVQALPTEIASIMATFVHLALEARAAHIRRTGITRLRKAAGARPSGVFAVPVTRSFFISHQWLRELKRRGGGPIAAIYFRIPDDQLVWVGHYGGQHRAMSSAEAVAVFMSADSREGWEVIIPRRIQPAEITRSKPLPQVVGWRYSPSAHGRRPCPCSFCSAGTFGARSIRQRLGGDT